MTLCNIDSLPYLPVTWQVQCRMRSLLCHPSQTSGVQSNSKIRSKSGRISSPVMDNCKQRSFKMSFIAKDVTPDKPRGLVTKALRRGGVKRACRGVEWSAKLTQSGEWYEKSTKWGKSTRRGGVAKALEELWRGKNTQGGAWTEHSVNGKSKQTRLKKVVKYKRQKLLSYVLSTCLRKKYRCWQLLRITRFTWKSIVTLIKFCNVLMRGLRDFLNRKNITIFLYPKTIATTAKIHFKMVM